MAGDLLNKEARDWLPSISLEPGYNEDEDEDEEEEDEERLMELAANFKLTWIVHEDIDPEAKKKWISQLVKEGVLPAI